MTETAATVWIPADRLRAEVARLLTAAGLTEADARTVAESMVEASLRGVDSHGVAALGTYLRRLRAGATNPRPQVRIVRSGPAYILVDGDNGLGAIAGTFAMERAIAGCRQTGIFLALCMNNTTLGAAFYYARMAALHGLVGITLSNAPPSMAPWGGRRPLLGTNPLSVAVPRREGEPIILDMATSAAAKSKIYLAREKGTPIPEGWALDPEGRPTTDPEKALKGLLMPLGGPKGYGLSLCIDLLTGALSGGGCMDKVASLHHGLDRGQNVSFLLAAIDPEHFAGQDRFLAEVEEVVAKVHGCPPAAGSPGVFLPGELEARTRQERLERGIPIPAKVAAEIRQEAAAFGMEVDWT
ncbi:MAG: Ldh family oxidoreductase [Bacillota bacterium]|nr:MAG: malate dehydrogenase [Bacillota bacterium]